MLPGHWGGLLDHRESLESPPGKTVARYGQGLFLGSNVCRRRDGRLPGSRADQHSCRATSPSSVINPIAPEPNRGRKPGLRLLPPARERFLRQTHHFPDAQSRLEYTRFSNGATPDEERERAINGLML